MNFDFTEEQSEIKRLAREFAESEIAPYVSEWDEAQTFPVDLMKKLAGLGFLGVLIPTEFQGSGLGYVEYVAILKKSLASTGPSA